MSSETTQTRKKTMTAWVVALTAIGSLMAALDTLVVSTSLSTIRLDLGASIEDLEWTVNAYNLSFAVLLITAAALGDRYGRRAFYAIGLGLFAAASAAAALAPSVGFLVAARAAQGAGAALVLTLGLTLLTAAFPPEKRGAAIGLFCAVTGIAVPLAPPPAAAIARPPPRLLVPPPHPPSLCPAPPPAPRKKEGGRHRPRSRHPPPLALLRACPLARLWARVRPLSPSCRTLSHPRARARPAAGVRLLPPAGGRAGGARAFSLSPRARALPAARPSLPPPLPSPPPPLSSPAYSPQPPLPHPPPRAAALYPPPPLPSPRPPPPPRSCLDPPGHRPLSVGCLSRQGLADGSRCPLAHLPPTHPSFLPPSSPAPRSRLPAPPRGAQFVVVLRRGHRLRPPALTA